MKKLVTKLFIVFAYIVFTITLLLTIIYSDNLTLTYSFDVYDNLDAIFFLPTGQSDCMIIESMGELAIIDAGIGRYRVEDEDDVVCYDALKPYLDKITGNSKSITIKYAISTHAHFDHMSGFIDILEDNNIVINNFLLKEVGSNGDLKLYTKLVNKLNEKKINTIFDVEDFKFNVGNFSFTILNGKIQDPTINDENSNSLCIFGKINDHTILLSGDISNVYNKEEEVASITSHVDVLKVPHHGFENSSTKVFLKTLSPKISIVTNDSFPTLSVEKRLKSYSDFVYLTGDANGVVCLFNSPNIIVLTKSSNALY